MDSRCSPEGVRQTHLANDLTNFLGQCRPSRLFVTAVPSPMRTESLGMQGDHGFGFDDDPGS